MLFKKVIHILNIKNPETIAISGLMHIPAYARKLCLVEAGSFILLIYVIVFYDIKYFKMQNVPKNVPKNRYARGHFYVFCVLFR